MKADPQNARWPHKLGEVNQRLERGPAAVDACRRAARIYAEQGFLLKAIALGKMIMTHPHVLAVVGEISARRREQALAVEEKLPLL
jgi:uncharacterized membrane protein